MREQKGVFSESRDHQQSSGNEGWVQSTTYNLTCDQASLYFRGGKVRLIQLLDYLKGAIHSTKISGLRFENFLVSNGSRQVRTVSFHSTRKPSFALNERCCISVARIKARVDDDFDGDINDIV